MQVDSSHVDRPGVRSAATSPTSVSNWLASALLITCFFLPHSFGDDGVSRRPVSLALTSSSIVVGGGHEPLLLVMFWPYLFAAATLLMSALSIWTRPKQLESAMLRWSIACGLLLSVLWIVLLFSGSYRSRMALVIAATVAPIASCVAARMVWLYRSGNVASAASWGYSLLCVLAVFSLRWVWFPPVQRLDWGGYLSIGAAFLMMFASWTWACRAQHDLVDRSVNPTAFQVSLLQIILAVAVTAIGLTYWQTLGG